MVGALGSEAGFAGSIGALGSEAGFAHYASAQL